MTIYEKNMKALKEFQPDFFKWLEKQPSEVEWIYPSTSGDNLVIKSGSKTMLLYSEVDMKSDPQVFTTLNKESVTVFVGLGLGRLQHAILTSMEKGHLLVVVEPTGQMIRWAFERHDFTKYLRDRSFLILPGKEEVSVYLPTIENSKVVGEYSMVIEPYIQRRVEFADLLQHVHEIVNQMRCNTGTVIGAGAKIADNDIATLPYVIRHRGVAELKDLFKGKPAVLVSTGPSLAKNIHLLRDLQKRALIIAVGQALRPLLAYGVRPDFICTVDFGEVNMSHFAGILDSDVPLVTINRTYAPLVKAYRGPKFIAAHIDPSFKDSAHVVLEDKGGLDCGGSVAHMCFGLAYHLGCDPIAFVGQDLAYDGENSHFNQADSDGKVRVEGDELRWKVNDVRSTLHNGDYTMGVAQRVIGYYGKPVVTNIGLLSFLTTFEQMVRNYERRVINATEGGAFIRGTEPMWLDDFAATLCADEIDRSPLNPLLTLVDNPDDKIRTVAPLLEKDIAVLDKIVENCGNALAIAAPLLKAQSKPRIKELLLDFDRNTAEAEAMSRKNPLVTLAVYWAQRRIMHRDMLNDARKTTEKNLIKNKKDLARRIQRSKIIITAARDAAESLVKTYREAAQTLKEHLEGKPSLVPSGETSRPSIADADALLEAKKWAKPLLEAERLLAMSSDLSTEEYAAALAVKSAALAMREEEIQRAMEAREELRAKGRHKESQYFNHILTGQELLRDKKYDKAIECMDKAIALFPDEKSARWGKATALMNIDSRLDECLALYKKLIEDDPEAINYRYEIGLVHIKRGEFDAAFDNLAFVYDNTDKYDHMLYLIGKMYASVGNTKDAIIAYELYVKKFPEDVRAVEELAELKKR